MKYPFSPDNVFWNGILKIGLNVYVKTWNKNEAGPLLMRQYILNSESCKNILCMIYGYLISKKEILPIDEMPVELLSDLESEAMEWDNNLTGSRLTKLMKSIWAMNTLLSMDSN